MVDVRVSRAHDESMSTTQRPTPKTNEPVVGHDGLTYVNGMPVWPDPTRRDSYPKA